MTTIREKALIEQTREALKRARKAELRAEKLEAMMREKQIPEPGYLPIGFGPALVAAGTVVTMQTSPMVPCIACRLSIDVTTDPKAIEAFAHAPLEAMRDKILERVKIQRPAPLTLWQRIFRWASILEDFADQALRSVCGTVEHAFNLQSGELTYHGPRGDFGEVYVTDFRIGRRTQILGSSPISASCFRGSLNEKAPEGPPLFMERFRLGELIAIQIENKGPVAVTIAPTLLVLREDVEVTLTETELEAIEESVTRELDEQGSAA